MKKVIAMMMLGAFLAGTAVQVSASEKPKKGCCASDTTKCKKADDKASSGCCKKK